MPKILQSTRSQSKRLHQKSLKTKLPCRSCWKVFETDHSQHRCLKQKRQERQQEIDKQININQFVAKNKLKIKKPVLSNQIETFIKKYCSIWRIPPPVTPISKTFNFKVPAIPAQKIPAIPVKRLPFKKRFLPIDYNRWYGHPHTHQTESQKLAKRHH